MSFENDVKKFKEKTLKRANQFKRAVAMELFSSVILDTPVDKGRARGGWQVSKNTPIDVGTLQTPAEAMTNVMSPAKYGKLSDANYLSNNVVYIERLEFGHSKQSPAGMVRKNIARLDDILEKNKRNV